MHQDLENIILLPVYPLEILTMFARFSWSSDVVLHSGKQKIKYDFANITKNLFDSQSLTVGKTESDMRFVPWYFDKIVPSCLQNSQATSLTCV